MSKWIGATILATAVAVMTLGCAQGPSATAVTIGDKTYAVTPASVKVTAGILMGEITEMKVTERVEQGSGRVVSPAKLTGTLRLKNTSGNQSVRLVAGKILYMDAQGRPIKLEEARSESVVKFTAYNNERLDPGQTPRQPWAVDFPPKPLRAKMRKEVPLGLATIQSPYQKQTATFGVSIAAGKC